MGTENGHGVLGVGGGSMECASCTVGEDMKGRFVMRSVVAFDGRLGGEVGARGKLSDQSCSCWKVGRKWVYVVSYYSEWMRLNW